jgi:Domain of unknown function (DUF1854)
MKDHREREQTAGGKGGGTPAHAGEPVPGGDLCFLDPRAIRARRNERGKLVVTLGGGVETVEGVRPLRAFPLTAPDRQIVLIDADDNELGVIRELQALDRESRKELEAELEVVYLVPRVKNIRSVLSRFGLTTWELETDRGVRTAHVKERTDIRPLPDGRIMLTDVDGVKYEIPPVEELDERSRVWLEIEA